MICTKDSYDSKTRRKDPRDCSARVPQDIRRHFVGEVTDTTESVVRAVGHAYIYDANTNLFVRKQHSQVRIFSLVDSVNIISVLPQTANLKKIAYRLTEKNRMVLTDGESLSMDVNEFGTNR